MKLTTCNEYFTDWPIEEVFDYAADLGYAAVEIAPFTLADSVEDIPASRRAQIRAAAERAGVEIAGLHWLLASPDGLYITHPDPAIYQRTCAYFKELVQFCGDLGGQVMIIGSPMQRNVQEGWDYQECWNHMRGAFEDSLELAQQHGVYLCIESLSKEQTNIISTCEEARKMVAEIDHPPLPDHGRCVLRLDRRNSRPPAFARLRPAPLPRPRQRRQQTRPRLWQHRLRQRHADAQGTKLSTLRLRGSVRF